MNKFESAFPVIAGLGLIVIIFAYAGATQWKEERNQRYLLEMGVPHCVVFDYDCSLMQSEGGTP